MAIGPTHIEWLSSLARRAEIPVGAVVLDLGPQDIQIDRASLRRVAGRHLDGDGAERVLSAIFDGEAVKPDAQRAFYSIFGAREYRSADLNDPRADYSIDLNDPLPADIGQYDVVTNFGTTEHIFNIGGTFASIHRLLNVGGIQLHAVPGYAFIDHGYYNLNPSVFLDVARANHYDVVDLLYIDNLYIRDRARRVEATPFDFGSLPITLADMADAATLMKKAALRFHHNLTSDETRGVLEAMVPAGQRTPPAPMPDERLPLWLVFDLLFVALRRTSRSPETLVAPSQAVFEILKQSSRPSIFARVRRRLGL
jgi:hypothetical protein